MKRAMFCFCDRCSIIENFDGVLIHFMILNFDWYWLNNKGITESKSICKGLRDTDAL